ncbi:SAM-dependent methyltransferase [Paludibacterium purpuratum]|uniref:Tetrapyrrole (Corrin/porphyrin) methylase-like protein n=1 Tax=Paludibacterium purpuratum TaxID=1144873 RepID=A0A4R7B5P1_9NEIS|nr:SAM-dependent methyltransferase [Paludibacterium purpuratum]TDR79723.1 tetrapyrrole (corrin/porphyrin) methylase-like protein [Paludibacterium purpuratum]
MPTVKIIGSGMLGACQITQEGIDAIKSSSQVFWLGKIDGLEALLESINVKAKDLSSLYFNNAIDKDNYTRILNALLVGSGAESTISLIISGHPRVGVTIVQQLQQISDSGRLDLKCMPGISSFDGMINDLALDPLEEGSCIVDANRLILYNYKMEASINYFIYHVCSIGNSKTNFIEPTENNNIAFLKNKLLEHYDKDHTVYLVSTSSSQGVPFEKIAGTLGALEVLMGSVSYMHSLFVPSIIPDKSRVNWDFLKRIQTIEEVN